MKPQIALEVLSTYALMGWPLFPCCASGPRAKAPLTAHGHKDATTDTAVISAWHAQYPGCAWGCATSADRGVIDVDPRHGGAETLAALVREHGPLPPTPKARTGGDGWHYWFRFPAGTPCGKPAAGIDRKADGGYVIVPPSRIDVPEHGGRAYAWEVRPWEVPLAEAPAWALSRTPSASASGSADAPASPWVVRADYPDLLTHPGGKRGELWGLLTRMIGVHIARGDSPATIWRLAAAWINRSEKWPEEPGWWRKHVAGLLAEAEGQAEELITLSPPSPIEIVECDWDGLEPPPEARKEGIIFSAAPSAEAEIIPSFPGSTEGSQSEPAGDNSFLPDAEPADEQKGEERGLSTDWPSLHPDAYHGLLGDMLRAVTPETEADPAGVLLGWLACFGNASGRGAWVPVGPRRHHPALFVGVCGRTSDAKGDCWGVTLWPFRQADPQWAGKCVCPGVGSGEGLVERIADEQTVIGRDGKAQVIPGAADKRCLLRLSELSRCFKVQRRENSTMSEYLREAWDGEPIQIPNRKAHALSTAGYAVSVVGDITPGVVRKTLEHGTEAFDGFANRFLWCAVRSPRSLPDGGNIEVLRPFLPQLAEALAFGRAAGEVRRDSEADALWREQYDGLKASGDSVPHTDRARPYVVRLSLLYALADCSRTIRREHLAAALAAWDYCRQSAALLFGGSRGPTPTAEPEPLCVRLLNRIGQQPGVSRSELLRAVREPAEQVAEALAYLSRNGLAHCRKEGRTKPAECWWPGPGTGPEPTGGGLSDDYPLSAPTLDPAGNNWKEGTISAEASAEHAGKDWKEGIISPAAAPAPEIIPSFPPSGGDIGGGGEVVINQEAPAEPDRGWLRQPVAPADPRPLLA